MRKTKYHEAIIPAVHKLAGNGMTGSEIAKTLGIARSTFFAWMDRHPDLREAFTRGMQEPKARAEATLYHRAVVGYDYTEEVVSGGKVHRVRRHLPPDPKLLIHYIACRWPDEWRAGVDVNHNISLPSPEEVAARAAELRAERIKLEQAMAPPSGGPKAGEKGSLPLSLVEGKSGVVGGVVVDTG